MAESEVTRRCVGCGAVKPKRELLRAVLDETGIRPDRTGHADGRGAYLCHNPACLEKAMKRKGFERSFRRAVPHELYEALREEISSVGS